MAWAFFKTLFLLSLISFSLVLDTPCYRKELELTRKRIFSSHEQSELAKQSGLERICIALSVIKKCQVINSFPPARERQFKRTFSAFSCYQNTLGIKTKNHHHFVFPAQVESIKTKRDRFLKPATLDINKFLFLNASHSPHLSDCAYV